jgi:hypothetical protein
MMKRTFFTLALTLIAFSAAGLTIVPAGPVSTEPVFVHVPTNCSTVIQGHNVERIDTTIIVTIHATFRICDPPLPGPDYIISLGTLPPGAYTVRVRYNNETPFAVETVLVRNNDTLPFVVHPFAVPTAGEPSIVITTPELECFGCPVRLFIGAFEVPGSRIQWTNDGIKVRLPNLPVTGLATVRLEIPNADYNETKHGAIYVFDRAQPADTDIFERILFPVLYDGGGLAGAHWVSEAAILNLAPWDIETYNDVDPIVCVAPPCSERIRANEYRPFNGQGFPYGATLLVPRADAEDLSFSLRARDTSRQEKGFGTAIPVVREKDMFSGTIALLDVPADPRFRLKLRAYAYENASLSAALRNGDGTFRHLQFAHVVPCGDRCETTPMYAELDLPSGAAGERVNVFVNSASTHLAWAFITVTNNETGEVTTVLPD